MFNDVEDLFVDRLDELQKMLEEAKTPISLGLKKNHLFLLSFYNLNA